MILHGFHGFLVMKGNYPILYLPMLISAFLGEVSIHNYSDFYLGGCLLLSKGIMR